MPPYADPMLAMPDLSDSPWYASVGKMDLPFGRYETNFFADPLTEDLGKAKETAVVAGVHNSFINAVAGVFNGDMDEEGKENHIDSYLGAFFMTLPQDMAPDLDLKAGFSYISNIADSDELTEFIREEFETDTILTNVPGAGGFLSISLFERFSIKAEYLCALDSFKEEQNFKPKSWHLEFAARPVKDLVFAIRYGGSEDALDLLSETQLGVVCVYEIFRNTSIGLEYLWDEYENKDEETCITTQVEVEF